MSAIDGMFGNRVGHTPRRASSGALGAQQGP